MRIAVWLVPSIAVFSLLLVGSVGLFALLIALNGVSEARGGPLIVIYLVLLLVVTLFTLWASRWSLQRLSLRTNWPLWLRVPIALLAPVAVATVILFTALFALVMVGVS
ncbi:MAG TPA: hypothetical protein PKE45_19705 [Caldilineaceae bacterium]|nr:hypothetical protein [Caldilineaceae bacterium]